jgi:hypothetical protein
MPTLKETNEATAKARNWKTTAAPYPPTFPFENEGDVIEGVFKGVREVEQDSLNDPGKKVMRNCYSITDDNGKDWSVWESAAIATGMESAKEGDYVHIEFKGKVPMDGGRSFKQFLVQIAS